MRREERGNKLSREQEGGRSDERGSIKGEMVGGFCAVSPCWLPTCQIRLSSKILDSANSEAITSERIIAPPIGTRRVTPPMPRR